MQHWSFFGWWRNKSSNFTEKSEIKLQSRVLSAWWAYYICTKCQIFQVFTLNDTIADAYQQQSVTYRHFFQSRKVKKGLSVATLDSVGLGTHRWNMDLVKFLFGVLTLAAIVAGQDNQRVQFPETAARSPQEFLSKVYDDSKIFTFLYQLFIATKILQGTTREHVCHVCSYSSV